jgi:hypothetical protein
MLPIQQHYRNDELDLGVQTRPTGKNMDFLLKKIQDKKQTGVEQQAISLGMVQSLSKQISANELAAKGIKLSIRDSIIKFIKKEIDQGQEQSEDVKKLLNVLETENKIELSQGEPAEPVRQSVQEFMEEPLPIL